MEEIILPHDVETERSVLGTLLRYNEHFAEVSDILTQSCFYETSFGMLYNAALQIVTAGGITDANSIGSYLETHNIAGISRDTIGRVMSTCSEMTLRQDVSRLVELDKRRRLWETLTRSANNVLQPTADIDEELEMLTENMQAISESKAEDGIASFAEAMDEVVQIVHNNHEGHHGYYATGFTLFDKHYLLRPRSLTILAAFTSVGKSALAMNITKNVARGGVACAYYSLEMGKSELAARSASYGAKVSSGRILNARLSVTEVGALKESIDTLRDLPIYIDEKVGADWQRTMRSIRRMVAKKGVKLVVIDYLQIFTQNGDSTEQSLARYAREAKKIARELDIAVILISQLNRSDKHPSIRMLRGSGQIEESADNVVLIDRPEAYPDSGQRYEGEFSTASIVGTAKLILCKGRGVGTGSSLVRFDAAYTRFYENEEDKDKSLPFPAPEEEDSKKIDWDNIYR